MHPDLIPPSAGGGAGLVTEGWTRLVVDRIFS